MRTRNYVDDVIEVVFRAHDAHVEARGFRRGHVATCDKWLGADISYLLFQLCFRKLTLEADPKGSGYNF